MHFLPISILTVIVSSVFDITLLYSVLAIFSFYPSTYMLNLQKALF